MDVSFRVARKHQFYSDFIFIRATDLAEKQGLLVVQSHDTKLSSFCLLVDDWFILGRG